jgi:uncharacterized protein (TIGR03437 family)
VNYNDKPGLMVPAGFGAFRFSNPISDSEPSLHVRVSEGDEVLIGASAGTGTDGILVAVKRPLAKPEVPADVQFVGGLIAFLPAAVPLAQSRFIRIAPATLGFVPNNDGTGEIDLPGIGSYRAALSRNGNYLIGAPVSGSGGLLFAVRKGSKAPEGLRMVISLSVERDALRSGLGSAVLGTDGSARFSLREHGPEGAGDFRGTDSFAGWVNGESTIAGSAAGTGADGAVVAASADSGRALLFAAVPAPVPTHQDGVFLHPFGIVDAASIAPTGNPLAPNSLASLYGLRLASSTQVAEQIPLPVSLAGTRVEVNGRPVGLLMVSPGQINLHLPESLDVDDAVVQVIAEAGSSEKIRIALAPASPGVFSVSQGGLGAGVVTHADYQLVSAISPATSGEVVIVFLTGLGKNQPPPWVSVNGQAAEVQYAGAHAVYVGLYQINIKLPVFAAADNAAVLTLRTRKGYGDTVTLAVAP